jgi:hypothetical protein
MYLEADHHQSVDLETIRFSVCKKLGDVEESELAGAESLPTMFTTLKAARS